MADTITIICPECEKSIKAPEDVVGKKIRCKGCGETFTAKAPKAAKAARPAKAKQADEEEEGAYGLRHEYLGPRCPDCAEAMEEGDIICLSCGYNTVTRQKPRVRKVREITGFDVFLWLLPGIACVLVVITLITLQLMYILMVSAETFGDVWYDFLGGKAFKIWTTIITIFLVYQAGRFAVSRLIFNFHPPEIEEKLDADMG